MNKYHIIILLLFLTISNCTIDDSILSSDKYSYIYYPLKVGNTWYFDRPNSENNPYMKRVVEGKIVIGNNLYYIVKDIHQYSEQYSYLHSDTLRVGDQKRIWQHISRKDYLLFDFSLKDGETYKFTGYARNPEDEYLVTIKKIELIQIKNSDYENCIEFFFDIPAYVDDEKRYIFSQGIGLTMETAREGPTFTLNYYEL